ncbi:hypothetical protein LguiB_029723 [Lonicera macranthoides]
MASGSSGRNNSNSKGFDFASDDILCSYEDYANQEGSNGNLSDPSIGANLAKEFHKSRMARSSVFPSAYSPPEEFNNQEVISTVERTMKKHTDNLMRFLEGISSRLSQLELYCYNLDKSIGEMRADLVCDHGEADSKLKSLDKHVQEVHRSVQILRDKQELAETQKELAKLQLAQKESSGSHAHHNEDRAPMPTSDPKTMDDSLALALPHQVAPQPSIPSRPVEQQPQTVAAPAPLPPQSVAQSQTYYLQVPTQASQGQYLPSDSQYRTPPPQQSTPSQVNQTAQVHPIPQYQQQWPQQLPQQVQPPQQSTMSPQMRPSSSPVYPSYMPSQPANHSPQETIPNSMPMQMQMPYGYSGAGRIVQPQPQPQPQSQPSPQHLKAPFGGQPGDGYAAGGPHPNAYMMYDSEAGRGQHIPQQPHYQQSNYPQNPQPTSNSNLMVRPPQFVRNNPYNELIEKLVSMGYRGDHVMSVIQRQEETGQPVDFNSVLDRLNAHSSGGSQRGWSG